jgi:hypothetical protein
MGIFSNCVCLVSFGGLLCDYHHFGFRGSSSDPESQAIVAASGIALGVVFMTNIALLTIGGPLLLVLTGKIRHLFWTIPAVNISLYIATIIARPYPGGIGKRFHMPGGLYTTIEVMFVVLSSLGTAALLSVVSLLCRMIRTAVAARNSLERLNDD